MRCEDYLPLIEEYFDGETDERTGERMRAHLASCADCAAALDALSFEQEIYARYDRGLEVAPSLWASVSAEIARGPMSERPATHQNFLGRLRDSVAASLAALTIRPALASSLALLVVGVAVGSLWLARKPEPKDKLVATANETNSAVAATPLPIETVAPDNFSREDGGGKSGEIVAELGTPAERESKRNVPRPIPTPTPDDPLKVLDDKPQFNALTNGTVNIAAVDEHAGQDNPTIIDAGVIRPPDAAGAPLLDPAQKELARHVEQAQMLLRSIKNARASDEGTVNVSYEKKLSRKLLAENATLQLDAETRGDKDSKQVLDSIEPFLLDIANMGDKPSREEMHSVKERMKQTEIIAALQVY